MKEGEKHLFYEAAEWSGIFITLVSLIYLIKPNEKFTYLANHKDSRVIKYIERYVKLLIREIVTLTKKEILSILIIIVLFASMTNQLANVPKYVFLGVVISLISIKAIKHLKEQADRAKKLKEVVFLFEAIELYIKAGYTVYQALRTAKVLTNKIRPAVDKCLSYWSASPKKALETLQEEIKLPGIEILVLLLLQMEYSGSKELQGAMKRESFNIEKIQKLKSQIKIANKPLILVVYKMLPLMAILGIVVGALLYRTYSVLTQVGIYK